MNLGLANKRGLVASSRGMGKAIAKGLTAEGMHVGVNGRDEAVLSATRDEIAAAELAEIPLGWFATIEEVASLVVFLASTHGSYITGQALVVDGGLVRSTF
jgi:3-oxoacyl-[acyl-carrier protein] reductase